ncbi:Ala-tRNA(Pro) deacylase [Enterococcus sp. AZ194]|uniref:prolyl-tRNA synthetase associated domain-containing protein n=1 Tax=Enterococcus sp. AZ194 TaxID=2774629 RepID=UPI003F1FF2EC
MTISKSDILDFLNESQIDYELMEHKAVYTMAELEKVELLHPEAEAKNLFIRDDKKKNYYLITVQGEKRIDLKEFRERHTTRPLSFASKEDLQEMLGLTPGAVTPLGLLNDTKRQVQFCIDEALLDDPGIIGVHPNDNQATIWLKTTDLIMIIRRHGNPVVTFTL